MTTRSRRHRPDTVKPTTVSGTIEVDAATFHVAPPLIPDLQGRLRQLVLATQADPAVVTRLENTTPAGILRTVAQNRIQGLNPGATAQRAAWARCSGLYWAYVMNGASTTPSFVLMLIAWRDDAGVWRTPQGQRHPDRETHALEELPSMHEHQLANPYTVLVC